MYKLCPEVDSTNNQLEFLVEQGEPDEDGQARLRLQWLKEMAITL